MTSACHLNRLGHRSDNEGDRDAHSLPKTDTYIVLQDGLEALQFHPDVVPPRCERGHGESTISIGRHGAGSLRSGDRDRCAGNQQALRVYHTPVQGAGGFLSARDVCPEQAHAYGDAHHAAEALQI
jgi:hypothetical protein